jgi:hypothetical protein
VAELADALDSKSSTRKGVWVRSPPPAHLYNAFYERELIKYCKQSISHGRARKCKDLHFICQPNVNEETTRLSIIYAFFHGASD